MNESEIDYHVEQLRERAAALEKELADIKSLIIRTEETKRGFNALHAPRYDQRLREWACPVAEIRDCSSIRKALEKMALLNGGTLLTAPAARLLIDAGLTTSTAPVTVSAGIYARLKSRQDWLHSGKGEFRFLPYFENPPQIHAVEAA